MFKPSPEYLRSMASFADPHTGGALINAADRILELMEEVEDWKGRWQEEANQKDDAYSKLNAAEIECERLRKVCTEWRENRDSWERAYASKQTGGNAEMVSQKVIPTEG